MRFRQDRLKADRPGAWPLLRVPQVVEARGQRRSWSGLVTQALVDTLHLLVALTHLVMLVVAML